MAPVLFAAQHDPRLDEVKRICETDTHQEGGDQLEAVVGMKVNFRQHVA